MKLSEIHKTDNLLFPTRVKEYWKRIEIKPNNRPVSYFLVNENPYTLGQLKTEEYFDKSEINFIPIIDQSKDLIAGYTDNDELVYNGKLPVVVFGDHTRVFKFVDFPFVQGADGIKILCPDSEKVNPLFFYYLLQSVGVPSRGYNRHFSLLSSQRYLLIDFAKQIGIVNQIKPIETEIQNLKNSKLKPLDIINKVFGEILGFDWAEFERLKIQKKYTSNLVVFANNIDCRMGLRFHNKAGEYLHDFLASKTNKKLKDFISEPIVLGKSVSPSDYDDDGEYFYIAMSNIKRYAFDEEDCKKVSEEYAQSNLKKTVKKGDILLARSGEGTIGKVALIEDEEINAIFADFTQRIRLKNYNNLFAYYFFRSDFFQYLVYTHKKGLGNNTNIFPSQIQEFPMLDWNEAKQTSIVEKIKTQIDSQNTIDKEIEEKQNEISKLIEMAITEQ